MEKGQKSIDAILKFKEKIKGKEHSVSFGEGTASSSEEYKNVVSSKNIATDEEIKEWETMVKMMGTGEGQA